MALESKERSIEVLESIIHDCERTDVSTLNLLNRCQEIVELLKLSEDESLWLDLEIQGYPDVSYQDEEAKRKFQVPHYRRITLSSLAPRPPFYLAGDIMNEMQIHFSSNPSNILYHIRQPIGQLENAKRPIKLTYSQIVDIKSKDRYGQSRDIPITLIATLTIDDMQGIVSVARGLAKKFASKHISSLRVELSETVFIHESSLLSQDLFKGITVTQEFERLVDEINKCYRAGCYTASGVLSRKLIENLLYYMMEKKYKNDVEKKSLIYNQAQRRIAGFSELIDVFKENFNDDFREHAKISKKSGIEKQIHNLILLKNELDMITHNLPMFLSKEDLEDLSLKIENVSRFIRVIWDSIL